MTIPNELQHHIIHNYNKNHHYNYYYLILLLYMVTYSNESGMKMSHSLFHVEKYHNLFRIASGGKLELLVTMRSTVF